MKNQKAAQVFILGLGLVISSLVSAAPVEKAKDKPAGDATFYIYADRGSRLNHYAPSGWMGDFGDLKLNQGWVKADKPATKDAKKDPKAATATEDTCIQIKYTAERKQGAGWGGIYWQHPANNWGDKRGGFDLSSYTKLTFWAKGERGDEVVDKFFIGGITGQTEEGDSDEASIAPVNLGKEWKQYTIDLKGLDLSHIIGGFGFAANADANPKGFNIYVDEIRLEK